MRLSASDVLVRLADGAGTAHFGAEVSVEQRENVQALVSGRLHYGDQPKYSHARQALHAYLKGGESAVLRLEGDFSVVILDRTRSLVIALRDAMGARPLFWRVHRGGLSISSKLLHLRDPDDEVLDLSYVAATFLSQVANPDRSDRTPYLRVNRLRPGHLLRAGFHDSAPQIHEPVGWAHRIGCIQVPSRTIAAEAFRERLTAAVRERTHGPFATHLSGGMDSTSVSLLATEINGSARALSLTFDRTPPLDRERVFRELARRPGLSIEEVPGDDLLDFDALGSIGPHAEPTPWLFRTSQDLALLAAASRIGASVVLTGQGADQVLALPPFEIGDDLRRLRLLRAYRQARAWALAHRVGAWLVLRQMTLSSGSHARPPRRHPDWLNPDFVKALDWEACASEARHRTAPGGDGSALLRLVAQLEASAGDWVSQELGAPMGVTLTHPFRDPQVASYGAAARLAFGADPRHPKPLLAAALAGLVPGPILDRQDKIPFNVIFYRGLARNRAALVELVRAAPAELDQFIRRDRLQAALMQPLGQENLPTLHGISVSLAVAKWLTLLPRWRTGETAVSPRDRTEHGG